VAMFFGRYEHSLDAKGRVILPARLRTSFETRAFLSAHLDRCLALWTPEEFEQQRADMEAAQQRGARDRNMVRVWASGVTEVELDKQGRVPIPTYLREFAGLESAVLVIGALNRIELWNPEEWASRVAPSVTSLTDPPTNEEANPSITN
jgi:MraZ protein